MNGLPLGWATSKIGALCTLNNGRAFKPTEWLDKGLPIVRIQNLNNPAASFNYYQGEVGEKYHLKGGELLFAWSGTPGTSFGAHVWRGGEAVLNQHIFRVDFDANFFDRRFFKHAINQTLDELIDIAHGGVGLRHITKGKFEGTVISVPPHPEQRRIADKLDACLARVDACRDRLARITPLLKRFRQSVLAAATSGRLTEDWRELEVGQSTDCKSVDDSTAQLPSWRLTTLGALTVDLRYGTSKKCEVEPTGIAVLRIPNIGNDGKPNLADLKYAEFDQIEVTKLALKSGDLLVIRSNGSVELVGKTCIVDEASEGLLFAGYLMRVRLDTQIADPRFMYLAMSEPNQRRRIEQTAKSTSGVNNINSEELRALPVRLPSLEEQHAIIRRVETLFAFADRLEARLAIAQTAADRLTPSLLARAFRGELVPQDPSDEPASELLKRLAASRAETPAKPRRSRRATTK